MARHGKGGFESISEGMKEAYDLVMSDENSGPRIYVHRDNEPLPEGGCFSVFDDNIHDLLLEEVPEEHRFVIDKAFLEPTLCWGDFVFNEGKITMSEEAFARAVEAVAKNTAMGPATIARAVFEAVFGALKIEEDPK